MPRPLGGSIKRWCCLTSVWRLSHTSDRRAGMARTGSSGPARPAWLKAAAAHFRCRGAGHIVAASLAACYYYCYRCCCCCQLIFVFFRPTFLEPFQTSYILKSPIIVESLADYWIRIFYLLLLFCLYSPLPQRGRDEGKSSITINVPIHLSAVRVM